MRRRVISGAMIVMVVALSSLLWARKTKPAREAKGEEFFIVSSVDVKKKQFVLKRPTEVTLLVAVTDKTSYQDDQGRPLRFLDFRAGDTVYVTFAGSREGTRIASRVRKGAMTVDELHRRYLNAR